jgi:hypothetical protein
MHRHCTHCRKEFTPQELARQESRGMEAERKAMGLQGVLFRYYTCAACGQADIFVDLKRLPGESEDAFLQRRGELETAVKQAHGEGVEAVLVEKDQVETALARKRLLDRNLEKIEAAYAAAAVADAVVIVADARDGLGEAISRSQSGDLRHQELLASFGAVGLTPTLILAVPRETACDLLGGATPKTDRMLNTAPRPGFFRVIVTGEGGVLFGEVAIPSENAR